MATRSIPILGFATKPDDSGDCWFEPADIEGANGFFKGMVLIFKNSGTDVECFGRFGVPDDYVGSPKLVIRWTTTAVSGDVEWGIAYRAVGGNDTESLDQATAQESLLTGNNDTAPSITDERMVYEIDLTASNFAIDDTVDFIFSREGADAGSGDTIAAKVRVYELRFQYSDV